MELKEEYIIELKNVYKKFNDAETYVVEDFNLKIKKGEFVTFLGPSGCGKTTTLRMIAGFDKQTTGEILLNGSDISSLPPYKRPINTVFQRYALFPHLNVYENIAFGLKLKKVPYTYLDRNGKEVTKMVNLSKAEIDQKVKHALEVVDLEQFETRDISTLSGGQQQRIAIARAIVNEPKILLLDEPLGALDLKKRKEMQLELKEMHKKLGITFIYVTHDQEEALTMSDRIVIMKDGQITKEFERSASLTQEDCYLIASHINSTPRVSLNNNSPYDCALLYLGKNNIDKLNIKKIEYDDIDLSYRLLRK